MKWTVRVDDGPAASVDVFLGDSLHLGVELHTDESGGQDVDGGGASILDDNN